MGYYKAINGLCNSLPVWRRVGDICEAHYLFRSDDGHWYVSKKPCESGPGLRSRKSSTKPFYLYWDYEDNGVWKNDGVIVLRKKAKLGNSHIVILRKRKTFESCLKKYPCAFFIL